MRVKRGVAGKRRHKKYEKLAKGFRGRRKNCFKFVKDAVERSLQFQFIGRKLRKRDMRKLWILRIGAATRQRGLSYSQFMNRLREQNVQIDRKILAKLAAEHPQTFDKVFDAVA